MGYTSQWSQTQESSSLGCCDTPHPLPGHTSNKELMARDIQCINPVFGASIRDHDSNVGAAEHKIWGAGGHTTKSPLEEHSEVNIQKRTFPGAFSRFAAPAGTGVATHPYFPFF